MLPQLDVAVRYDNLVPDQTIAFAPMNELRFADRHADGRVNPEFFLQLALQRLRRILAGVGFSSWQLPAFAEVAAGSTTHEQQTIATTNQRGR